MKFGYTILYVPDPAAATAFYAAAFGIERRFITDDGDYAELATGATTVAFAREALAAGNGVPFAPVRPDAPPPAVELGFVTDDVPAAFVRAVAAGAAAVRPPAVKPWGQVVAYVRDTNGFLVELCTPMGG